MRTILSLFRRKIQYQLLIPMLLLVIIPTLLVGYILATELFDVQIASLNESEELESSFLRDEAHLFLTERVQDILFLSGLSSVDILARSILADDAEAIENARAGVINDFLSFANAKQIYLQVRFIDVNGMETTRIDYNTASRQPRIVDGNFKGDRDYFTDSINLPPGEVYVSSLNLNREGSPPTIQVFGNIVEGFPVENKQLIPVLRYARPIYVQNPLSGRVSVAGIVVTNVHMDTFFNLFETNHGEIILANSDGYSVFNSANPLETFAFEAGIGELNRPEGSEYTIENRIPEITDPAQNLFDFSTQILHTGLINIDGNPFTVHTALIHPPGAPDDYHWTLISLGDRQAITQVIQQNILSLVLQLGAFVLIAVILVILVARNITSPLGLLSQKAGEISQGNYNLGFERIDVNRQDEIGALDESFSVMARQVYGVLSNLETLVAERTRDLQTAVDVSSQIATILDVDRLLQDVVDLTKERFGLYHAHIYIMNEDETQLTLTAGAGHVGRQMVSEHRTIDVDNRHSVVATVARTHEDAIFNDVTKSPTFLAHPLLPDTKSELAVPLIARGRVLGVLDVQGDRVDFFNEERLVVVKILASQIANTLSNATLFETVDTASRHERAMGAIDRQIQQAIDVDEVLRVTVRELGKALRTSYTAIELGIQGNGTETSNN
jgi:putative methionine-R-sulfoxide reductase with GAF domain